MDARISGPVRNNRDRDPVPSTMNHRALALSFAMLAFTAACTQMPPRTSSGTPGARYVDSASLTNGDAYSDAQVLTSVPLLHVSAADAEARLRGCVPEGVRVSCIGQTKQLLIQGRGWAVTESIMELRKIDVR